MTDRCRICHRAWADDAPDADEWECVIEDDWGYETHMVCPSCKAKHGI